MLDHCLITAAGHGTRMGEIGKVLPKPLWPVFEVRMIDFAIKRARLLNINNIFVNVHHQSQEISNYLSSEHPDVIILREESLLGSGGAIHNMATHKLVNGVGQLLVLNADVCYEFDYKSFIEFHNKEKASVTLSSLKISCEDSYNTIIFNDNVFKGVGEKSSQGYTYSGVCLIDLAQLKPHKGFTNFFDSVVQKTNKNLVHLVEDGSLYLDWGTTERYVGTCKLILDSCISPENQLNISKELLSFILIDSKILKLEKSYGSSCKATLNFSNSELKGHYRNCIIINESEPRSEHGSIVFNHLVQKVE